MCKKIVKVALAILIFVILFVNVQHILMGEEDTRDSKRYTGFYELDEDSLDAVYIGSSGTYASWLAPYAWYEYGIAVYPYSTSGQPIVLSKYLIEEVHKTQPNAKVIVSLSSAQIEPTIFNVHGVTDNMPFSMTKMEMIYDLTKLEDGFTQDEMWECYFPILRYHDRWSSLMYYDFNKSSDPYMSGPTYKGFLDNVSDVTIQKDLSACYEELSQDMKNAIVDCMEYCEENKIELMFVIQPQGNTAERQMGLQNSAVQFVEEQGGTILDMRQCADEIGIDYTTDFYNPQHSNMHGAIKSTSYFAEYLIETYDFEDKRGDERYLEWDIAFEKYYKKYLEPRLTDVDRTYFTTPIDFN